MDTILTQLLRNELSQLSQCVCAYRGTPGWTAPEMYVQNLPSQQQHKSVVCAKADIYAAGWVFFEVLSGLSPLLFQDATSDDEFAASKSSVLHKFCGLLVVRKLGDVLPSAMMLCNLLSTGKARGCELHWIWFANGCLLSSFACISYSVKQFDSYNSAHQRTRHACHAQIDSLHALLLVLICCFNVHCSKRACLISEATQEICQPSTNKNK